ncbi:MAG: hypothetical protein ACI4MB_01790 [Candidatus Coproplasma sp.]
MNKSKKVLIVVATAVLALLFTAMVLLLCLLPSKNDGPTNTGSDDTTQTPGDSSDANDDNSGSDSSDTNGGSTNTGSDDTQQTPGDSTGGDDTPQTPGDSTDNSGSTDNPSDTDDPVDEFTFTTPSAIKLSIDKTELTAGETFTLTVEIETKRVDMYWEVIDMVIGPMTDNTTVSTDIAQDFELINYTINKKFKNGWVDNSSDLFSSNRGTGGFRISLVRTGANKVSTEEKFELTAQIKVKETAIANDAFLFGITESKFNVLNFTKQDNTIVCDYADGITEIGLGVSNAEEGGITVKPLTLCIKESVN